jgi:multiple sugar transport system substrate-binding protein
MKQKLKRFLSLGLVFSTLALTGQSCLKGSSGVGGQAYQPISLEYWTVFNSPDDYSQVIADYSALHPNVRINVKKFRFDEYEELLVNALAEDRGPDILSVHNTWVPSYRAKLLPLPAVTSMAYQYTTGSISKETITELRSTRSLNTADVQRIYVEQAFNDVTAREFFLDDDGEPAFGAPAIYALPIAYDTMVLYYNRDLLDNAGIPEPATYWHEFQEDVQQLARFDSQGRILAAGAALGTANNVPRATDILTLLMMQNGAQMIDDEGEVVFDEFPPVLQGERSSIPGEQALRFYTSFANENNRNYTWNNSQPNGLEAFIEGKSAYFFGYQYHEEQIKGLAPKLNFTVTTFPQIQGNEEVYFANYWVESVSKKTRNPDAAWDFVQFMTGQDEAAKFLEDSGKLTARRDLLEEQAIDPAREVYINQILRSKSWYNGNDPAAAESIMRALLNDVLNGAGDVIELLELAADRVQQTMRFN